MSNFQRPYQIRADNCKKASRKFRELVQCGEQNTGCELRAGHERKGHRSWGLASIQLPWSLGLCFPIYLLNWVEELQMGAFSTNWCLDDVHYKYCVGFFKVLHTMGASFESYGL